jgi:CRISPR-associated RAMP protein (TIGR02581 family)
MHKRLFNETIVKLTISPVGPILIKAGEGEADPTKPDMNFVRTIRNGQETVYLPGSSLKGVLRAHCERLARTVQGKRQLACDPLDNHNACGKTMEGREWTGAQKYNASCFICRLFGNTSLASHFRIADAYPIGDEPRREERNGVAIDRVFGSVAVGPFNYETVTAGEFKTSLHIKNFTLAQIGLLALALRDISAERIRLGFGKSRGLGLVTAQVDVLTLRYPLCEMDGGQLRLLGGKLLDKSKLYGVGAFVKNEDQEMKGYGYPPPNEDTADLPPGYGYTSDGWLGGEIKAPEHESGGADWHPLGRACVPKWKEEVNRDN